MDLLKFTLKGKTAFFKKPEVNTYFYFTFGNIHKVALLGIFGAILGLRGYSNADYKSETYPEFYEKLRDLECSIVPTNKVGFINKKIQLFNNSVGYASQEKGGNLIVKEQWLENPKWDVYVKLNSEIANELAESIINSRCIYIPYLGKNDHPADIVDATIIRDCSPIDQYESIDSLFIKDLVQYGDIEEFYEENFDVKVFKYEENLPIGLEEKTNMYFYETFVNTNLPIEKYDGEVYKINNRNIVFN